MLAMMVAAPVTQANADQQRYITVRATSALPDVVTEYIARKSEPAQMEIRPRESPEAFIRAVCGINSPAFDRVFYELNSTLVRTAKEFSRKVRMPACIKWRRDVAVKVLPNETIEMVLKRKTGRGADGPARLACSTGDTTQRCTKMVFELVRRLNPGINLNPLSVDELILPVVTFPTTIQLKAGIDPTMVRDEIEAMVGEISEASPIIENYVTRSAWLISPVDKDDITTQGNGCKNAALESGRPWPYDAKLVAKILRKNLAIAKRRGNNPQSATVTVLDTGLDTTSFPKRFLKRDDSRSGGGRFGRGVVRDEQVIPFKDASDWRHGTFVAEILTGGAGLREEFPELHDLLRINVVNLVEERGDGYEYSPSGINIGVNFAIENAGVANMSVTSESELYGFLSMISQKELIVVVAAGNDKKRLGDISLYPANYGGINPKNGDRIITVMAHDGKFEPTDFTNWGDYADIAAPGCAVPYSTRADADKLHGTSVATPLVSMTVALLRSFGVKAYELKGRLQASADREAALYGLALWNGRLNIAKALSLYEDVLTTRKREHIFGKWELADSKIGLCTDGTEAVGVGTLKIDIIDPLPPFRIAILGRDSEGRVKTTSCIPSGSGLDFIGEDGVRRLVLWSDVSDVLIRYFGEQDDEAFLTTPLGKKTQARTNRPQRRM